MARQSRKKVALPNDPENYTVFHAFFEALKDQEKKGKKSQSLLKRLKFRK